MTREEVDDSNPVALAIWEFENAINGSEADNNEYPNYCIHINEYKTALAALKTCAVKLPKDAQCIVREQENGWREDRLWSCSACGDERAMDGLPDEYDYNYCINCGAKIIGQEPLKLEVDE